MGVPVTRQPHTPLNLEGRAQAGPGLQASIQEACGLPEGRALGLPAWPRTPILAWGCCFWGSGGGKGGVSRIRRYHDIVPDPLFLSYQNLISDFPRIPLQGSITSFEPPGEEGRRLTPFHRRGDCGWRRPGLAQPVYDEATA